MTFSRVNVWAGDVDTITGAQITQLDTNVSLALDGVHGGNYLPTATIVVDTGGLESDSVRLDGVVSTSGVKTVSGLLALTNILSLPVASSLRIVPGAIISGAADATIDPADGLIRQCGAPAGVRKYGLVAAGSAGRFMVFTRTTAGGFDITIRRTLASANPIVTLTNATWGYAIVYDDGANWRLLASTGPAGPDA